MQKAVETRRGIKERRILDLCIRHWMFGVGRSAFSLVRALADTISDRNLVFVRFGGRRSFRRGRGPAARARSGFFISATTAAATRATAEELETFADNFQFAALLPRLFVVPSVELQTPFDENGASLF